MSNLGIEWFNLSNYKNINELTYSDWLLEINERINAHISLIGESFVFSKEMENLVPNINTHQQAFNELGKHKSLKTIGLIKQHGLLKNSDTRELNSNIIKPSEELMPYSEYGEILKEVLNSENNITVRQLHEENRMYAESIINRSGWMFPTLLEVDINAHPKQIEKDFKLWLDGQMKLRNTRTKMRIDEQIYRSKAYNILAYWDLKNISQIDGLELSAQEIGELLFPTSPADTVSDKVRKTVKPQCESFFSVETITLLSYLM
jgi:hypothetical protein